MQRYSSHKNLIVYQRSEQLTIECYKYFLKQKTDYKYKTLIDQLLRSVGSIGANISEGYGRHYQKSYRQFLSVARGSAFESEYWLQIMLELKIFDNDEIKKFQDELTQILKMLTALMKKLEEK